MLIFIKIRIYLVLNLYVKKTIFFETVEDNVYFFLSHLIK